MVETFSEALRDALETLAKSPEILIALDFDGTLAPLVDDYETSRMIAPARSALEELSTEPGVTIALVTGRSIDSVKRVADPLASWFVVGSHGIEILGPGEISDYETPWLVPGELVSAFATVAKAHPGCRLEQKPFGLALHTRGVEESHALAAEAAAHQVCDEWPGDLVVRTGFGLVECSLGAATKGDGIRELHKRINPDATLFAGDDKTDEDGFGVLGPLDVGIRIGPGDSIAPHRLADAYGTAEALGFILANRPTP